MEKIKIPRMRKIEKQKRGDEKQKSSKRLSKK